MMGSASIISPIVEGIVIRNASRIARESSLRNETMLPVAAIRASSGRATVPRATPKIPSGICIRRKAAASQKVGPSPSFDAYTELTSTLTWVVLAATTEGPGAEIRIEPVPQQHATDDRAEIEEARGHCRHSENALGVQHSHHQGRKRHQQNEG